MKRLLIVFIVILACHPFYGQEVKSLGRAEFYWLLNGACVSGDVLAVRILLDAGADPSGPTDFKEFVKKQYNGAEPDWHLCCATWNGHTEVVSLLLKAGADPNLAVSEGYTALTIAASKGYTEIARILLDNGADKKYKQGSRTALDIAEACHHLETADVIRSHEKQK